MCVWVCVRLEIRNIGEWLPILIPLSCPITWSQTRLPGLRPLVWCWDTHIAAVKTSLQCDWEFSEKQGDQIKEESFTVNQIQQQNSLHFPSNNSKTLFLPLQPDKVRGLKQTGCLPQWMYTKCVNILSVHFLITGLHLPKYTTFLLEISELQAFDFIKKNMWS